ncbi:MULTISPECIES: GFA family protein [Gulbenkiania]|uniref:Uncharacterized conserved protein n=2 Tax=Gulbenkiania TaxID=397456 RepID=A0A0K6H4W2_9NEIS|nr:MULTISPECIES: GFA family protein [Gulbenkiania]TCW30347.1 hypothetical protein EV669_107107 [Gulbenkiania mobilis]CUA85765.1 Uncharacterized conserved protein [Gulbenkiania indica]
MEWLSGSCLCGAVRYQVRGEPLFITHCHCQSCRKASGAAFVTWFTVRDAEVEWRGTARTLYRSSAAVERGFCPHCGTPLSYHHEAAGDEIDITAATLDQAERLVPEDHTWWRERLPWIDHLADLPAYAQFRRGRPLTPAQAAQLPGSAEERLPGDDHAVLVGKQPLAGLEGDPPEGNG